MKNESYCELMLRLLDLLDKMVIFLKTRVNNDNRTG